MTRAWVRRLSNPSKQHELCACPESVDRLPTIFEGFDGKDLTTRRAMNDLQWAMFTSGQLAKDQLNGRFDAAFGASLASYQAMLGAPQSGSVDGATWSSMQRDYCPAERYSVMH